MAERKKERSRKQVDNPTEPPSHEKKTGKQTKFVLDVGDLNATPDEIESIRSHILKSSIELLNSGGFKAVDGGAIRPKIGVELFSVSFSMSFSLGA